MLRQTSLDDVNALTSKHVHTKSYWHKHWQNERAQSKQKRQHNGIKYPANIQSKQ